MAATRDRVQDLYRSLGVDADFRPPALGEPVNESQQPRQELPESLLVRLRDHFRESDQALADLLGRPLPWA